MSYLNKSITDIKEEFFLKEDERVRKKRNEELRVCKYPNQARLIIQIVGRHSYEDFSIMVNIPCRRIRAIITGQTPITMLEAYKLQGYGIDFFSENVIKYLVLDLGEKI
jgi:hypothetical protein